VETGGSSRRHRDVITQTRRHRAVRSGAPPVRFRPADVRQACPGWADHTFGVFFPKHRQDNPGGYTAYFKEHPDGSYSLL
jgi:hypothetical protein